MFSDMGFGTSACNAFVLEWSAGRYQKAANIFKTGLFITTGCVLFGIFLSFAVMIIAKTSGMLGKSLIPAKDAIIALTFMMASQLFNFYNQLFEALFRSSHHAATSTNYRSVQELLNIAVSIIILKANFGIVIFALSSMVVSIVFNIGYAFLAMHSIGIIPKGHFVWSEVKAICWKGFGYLAFPLWQAIYFQGSIIIVRFILGASEVALFSTARKVCNCIKQVCGVVNGSVFPEL